MKTAPFSRKDAIDLASQYQYLVGKHYKDKHNMVHTIEYVTPVPYAQRDKLVFISMFYMAHKKGFPFMEEIARHYIHGHSGKEFDVVMITVTNNQYGNTGGAMPLRLIANKDGLDLGFDIETID